MPTHIDDAMISALEKLIMQHETGIKLLYPEDYLNLRKLLINIKQLK